MRKRIFILLAGFLAAVLMTFAATASANAGGDHVKKQVTYCVAGTTTNVDQWSGEDLLFSFALKFHKTVYSYSSDDGAFYSLLSKMYIHHHWVDGIPISLAEGACPVPPKQVNNSFDCYNASGAPEVFEVGFITDMLQAGERWAPYWVAGNVAGGTNIGSGHLVCAIPSGMSWDGVTIADMGGSLVNGSWAIVGGKVVFGGYFPYVH